MLGMARTDLERMRQEIEERDVRLAQLEGEGGRERRGRTWLQGRGQRVRLRAGGV